MRVKRFLERNINLLKYTDLTILSKCRIAGEGMSVTIFPDKRKILLFLSEKVIP
ncbi:hypothetical protein SAMN05660330_03286 [Desulforhopalus singaporensis]|uniref:Uncharacterized protein n=1 Tax=Desulforhopalus singaporensis TaxID=91360 RepID=A0A1H0TXH2_9BACT|nr:hypothetical protein SAMN05660330_03286 [Desulforhopalus singaporensis]